MDFPFLDVEEIKAGLALKFDDASGGVVEFGAKMQYFVPCRSYISDLWNSEGGEQRLLTG